MFQNYMKIAFRNMKKQKVFSFINILGLAIGVSVVIFLFLFVDYELNFDSHLKNKENIYRVVMNGKTPTGMEYSSCTYFPLSQALRSDFPDLKAITQTNRLANEKIKVDNEEFKIKTILFVEPDFYNLFSPKWIVKDNNFGKSPLTVVLTESLAKRLFKESYPVGKHFSIGENKVDVTVTGIIADPPAQSSLPYDMLVSWTSMNSFYNEELLGRWNYSNGESQTFLKLSKNLTKTQFESMLDNFKLKYLDKEDFDVIFFRLQPFSDIHFNSLYGSYSYITSTKTLLSFGFIGLLILIIACINFINLTTARAMIRAKEVGMRKVFGADRKMIVGQLIGETGVFVFIALLIGFLAVYVLSPYLTGSLGISIDISRIYSNVFLVYLCCLFLFLIIVNGIYPAFVLSRYKPVEALKNKISSNGKSSQKMRNSLVLIQFAVTQTLIVITLIIASQANFLMKKNLGFKKDNILIVECPSYDEVKSESLRQRLMENSSIENVSFAYQAPSSDSNIMSIFQNPENGNDTEYRIAMKPCDSHYLDVYNIPLLAGKYYRNNVGSYSNPQWVVNEDMLKKIGIRNPDEAIGKQIKINGKLAPVIGVVGDFHVSSLKDNLKPVVLLNTWSRSHKFAHIRLSGNNIAVTMEKIKDIWRKTYPKISFNYKFLDEQLQLYYSSEIRILKLIEIATSISIMLGCLGLLGLVSFVLAQKTKEIAIRKVLGASFKELYFHISKYFIFWIVMSNIISWPIAWYFSKDWLSGFAFRININFALFIFGSSLVLGIALIVISFQVVKATMVNPVESLKYE